MKINHLYNRYYLYLALIFIFFSYILVKGGALASKIHLTIQGGGTQRILNESFYKEPNQVYVNDAERSDCKKTCELPEGTNKVTLVFEDKLTTTEYMFKDLTNIIEADLSEFDASKVTLMNGMFWGCNNVQKINFGETNTSSLKR